jgi:hypothetical protein
VEAHLLLNLFFPKSRRYAEGFRLIRGWAAEKFVRVLFPAELCAAGIEVEP